MEVANVYSFGLSVMGKDSEGVARRVLPYLKVLLETGPG
jgi:hypothetical protein